MLAKSGFRFKRKWAGLLPGSSEGIYGFVAANYLSGALQKPLLEPDSLLGVVELGGASLQVKNPMPLSITVRGRECGGMFCCG